MRFSSFHIQLSDAVLDDLRDRLRRTRFTTSSGEQPWQGGVDPAYLTSLVNYWADGFDWRQQEAGLNAVPHYLAEIDGRRLHFVRLQAVTADGSPPALPLLLTHGWPSSFVEMLPLAARLSDPGGASVAFDVVIPSLPGFLFSDPQTPPVTHKALAATLHRLITEVLGYQRYGAFGADVGAGVTEWLSAIDPDRVAGIHSIHPPVPADFGDEPPTPQEQAWFDAVKAYDHSDQGYSEIMRTRPDTLAAALADSLAGLAAWIVDKYRDWSDCHGDLETRFDRDALLTIATLYWATGCIGSSFRQYFDYEHNGPAPAITVPAGFAVSAEPLMSGFPRSLAERACTDLRQWSEPGRGGHFMPFEEPDLLATELRTFFGSLS